MKLKTDDPVALKNATRGATVIWQGSTLARSVFTCNRKNLYVPEYPTCPPLSECSSCTGETPAGYHVVLSNLVYSTDCYSDGGTNRFQVVTVEETPEFDILQDDTLPCQYDFDGTTVVVQNRYFLVDCTGTPIETQTGQFAAHIYLDAQIDSVTGHWQGVLTCANPYFTAGLVNVWGDFDCAQNFNLVPIGPFSPVQYPHYVNASLTPFF
jgi:hypothetical protein